MRLMNTGAGDSDGVQHPDFSSSGAPLTFGLFTAEESYGGMKFVFDNTGRLRGRGNELNLAR